MAAGTYEKTYDRTDLATTGEGLAQVMAKARELVPALGPQDVIAAFAGLRATNSRDPEDYIIEPHPALPQFINVIICPPGLTSCFGVARTVCGMLRDQGLRPEEKPDFQPRPRATPRFSEMDAKEKAALIAANPACGHIVCRCETVTEAEVVEAVRRGATTLDGIRRRTRLGMAPQGSLRMEQPRPGLMPWATTAKPTKGADEVAITRRGDSAFAMANGIRGAT